MMEHGDRLRKTTTGSRRGLAMMLLACILMAPLTVRSAIEPMEDLPPGLGGTDYLVDLSTVVNAESSIEFPSEFVTVRRIPFRIVNPQNGAHLFLEPIGWPDWDTDPSSFSAVYDARPRAPDPKRAMVDIPVDDYSDVYLLAYAEDDEAFSNLMTLRIGAFGGRGQTTIEDFEIEIPRASATRGPGVMQTISIDEAQRLFLIRVPIQRNFSQLYSEQNAIDVDITKEVRLAIRRPDPNRFNYRPLGLPSGVRIYAMTFRRASPRMTVNATEADQVFVAPDAPAYEIRLDRVRRGNYQVEAAVTGPYGESLVFETDWQTLANNQRGVRFQLPMPVETYGYYEAEIRLMSGRPDRKSVALRHTTTFALLPEIDRPYRDDSPFGTWDFWGGHYTPNDPDMMGPAKVKLGLRYTMMARGDREILEPYGLLDGRDQMAAGRGGNAVPGLVERYAEKGDDSYPPILMLFHENAISGPHISRTPDVFTGADPYEFDENEQERFDNMWNDAMAAAADIREHFPKTEIYFGNGNPHLMEEFLRREFPKEFFGSRGNEAGSFGRMPETQPLNWVANNAGLFMDRMIMDHYGYEDAPLRQNFEITYPSTNPGNLSLNTQANYFIRHIVHSMAWEIPLIRVGMMTDVGNSYYHSNWGSSGFMFGLPNVSPKPAYVAMATLTQQLDGAQLHRVIEVPDAPTVFMVEFSRRAGGYVAVAWTPRGSRALRIGGAQPSTPRVTDRMGNTRDAATVNNGFELELSPSPVFIRSEAPLNEIIARPSAHRGPPADEEPSHVVTALDDVSEWTVDTEPNLQLEVFNHKEPRRKGNFAYTPADIEGPDGEQASVLKISPQFPVEGSHYLRAYSVLRHDGGIEIEGEPTEIGLMVHGNAGFGRVIFELSDASGQKWISIGAAARGDRPNRWLQDWLGAEEFAKIEGSFQSDWNANDVWGRSVINFEGWRYLSMPLPGNYPGEGYHWPYSSQWFYDGDGVVHYPLQVDALIFTAPENVLKFTRYEPPSDYAFHVRDLRVSYRPVESIGPE